MVFIKNINFYISILQVILNKKKCLKHYFYHFFRIYAFSLSIYLEFVVKTHLIRPFIGGILI